MTYEVYPTLGGPGGGLGPHFIIKDGKMYRAWGHPEGENRMSPCCYQSGDYLYRDMGDNLFKKRYSSWTEETLDAQGPIFAIIGNHLHTETGHPEGYGKIYYELREKEKVQPQTSPSPAPSAGTGTRSAYSGSSFGEDLLGIVFGLLGKVPLIIYAWLILTVAHTIYSLYALRLLPSPSLSDILTMGGVSIIGMGILVTIFWLWREPRTKAEQARFHKIMLISLFIAAGHLLYRIPTLILPEWYHAHFLQRQVFVVWLGTTTLIFTFVFAAIFVGLIANSIEESKNQE